MKQRQNDPGAPSTLPCAPVSAAAPRPTAHTGRYAVSFQRSADDTPSSWSTTARPPPATGAKAADMAWIYFLQDVWQAGSVSSASDRKIDPNFIAAKRPKNHLGGCPRGRIVWLAGYFCANKPLILCLRGICRVPNVPRGRRLLPPLWRWSLVMLLALTLQTSDPDHPKIGAI